MNTINYGEIEYKMSPIAAKHIVQLYGKCGKNPQQILCDYVNRELHLKGVCVRVHY